jgi:2-keto-4-pentenoate hydratase/2-oxohepta-3-ene-1,7-dioic acid hydratase in catechol pathway
MRLATIQTTDGPRAVVQSGDFFIDLHATDRSVPASMRQLLSMDAAERDAALHGVVRSRSTRTYPVASAKLLAPVPDPQKIICIGLNYKDHAAESGTPIPKEPVLFSKYPTALIGHGANIVLPRVSNKVDYEAELVIVVGRRGRPRNAVEALDFVAGYSIGHDVSARDWQLEKDGKQWMVGKTFDTFAPVGPVLVTADEVPDPHALPIRLRLNGRIMQESNTDQMIFRTGVILAFLAQVLTLEPGDVIFTGTPPGVGMARKPQPVWLQPGDVAEVEIEGLGLLRNPVVAE